MAGGHVPGGGKIERHLPHRHKREPRHLRGYVGSPLSFFQPVRFAERKVGRKERHRIGSVLEVDDLGVVPLSPGHVEGVVEAGESHGAAVLVDRQPRRAATIAIGVGWIDNAIEALFGIVGVALGAVYPLMMTLTGQRFPHARGMAAGLVGAAGALGGLCIPWLTGAIGDGIGIVPAVATLACWSLSLGFAAMFARGPGRA